MSENQTPQSYRDAKGVIYGEVHPELAKELQEHVEWFKKTFGEDPFTGKPC